MGVTIPYTSALSPCTDTLSAPEIIHHTSIHSSILNQYLELRYVYGLIGPGLRPFKLIISPDYKTCEQDRMQTITDALRFISDRCSALNSWELISNGEAWSIFHKMRRIPILPRLQHFGAANSESEPSQDSWNEFPDFIA